MHGGGPSILFWRPLAPASELRAWRSPPPPHLSRFYSHQRGWRPKGEGLDEVARRTPRGGWVLGSCVASRCGCGCGLWGRWRGRGRGPGAWGRVVVGLKPGPPSPVACSNWQQQVAARVPPPRAIRLLRSQLRAALSHAHSATPARTSTCSPGHVPSRRYLPLPPQRARAPRSSLFTATLPPSSSTN
jgi:hypothetical protein